MSTHTERKEETLILKHKTIKRGLFCLFALLFVVLLTGSSEPEHIHAADAYTYYGHDWETPSSCSNCGGDHVIGGGSSTCTKCNAGKLYYCRNCNSSGYKTQALVSHTIDCKGALYGNMSCSTCGGDGQIEGSTSECSKCYASGTYKGKNTRCKNASWSGCGKGGYAAWSDYPGGTCYSVLNSFTQTTHHYVYNVNTGGWDYWYSTYASAQYGSVYTPSYVGAPTGYYAYSIDWAGGWTVSGEGTFCAYYYPWSYEQTMNHYLYNIDTGAWDYWTTTTGWALYGSVFTPYYTDTPAGYYNYSYTWAEGWTVSGNGVFNVHYYPNLYYFVYNPNGASGSEFSQGVYHNSTYTIRGGDVYSRPGYTLTSWNTLPDGTGAVYNLNGTGKCWWTYNVTLYAQWTPNTNVITYDANGGTGAPASQTFSHGQTNYVSGQIPTRHGYTFKYWSSTPTDETNKVIEINNPYVKKAKIHTYMLDGILWVEIMAACDRNDLYLRLPTWTYNPNDASTGQDDLIWYDFTNGSWERDGVTYNYVCTFPFSNHNNELTTVKSEIYVYSEPGKAWNDCLTTYTFPIYGVNLDPNSYFPLNPNNSSATLYAQWKENIYTVSYNANGGNGSMSDTLISQLGGSVPTNTFTRYGYTFMGWSTSMNGTVEYANGATIYPDKDTTLYAVWQINSHKVTYDANGGTCNTSYIMHDYNSNVDLSVTATKAGYKFVGWSTNASSKMPLTELVMDDYPITLYAVYTIEVSDIENHTYPDYYGPTDVVNDEVYLLIQLENDSSKQKVYPLTYQYDVSERVYRYKLEATDVSSFVGNNAYYYYIIARDNAGNQAVISSGTIRPGIPPSPDEELAGTPVLPEEYPQTVKHYKYNPRTESSEKWDWFETTTTIVVENTTFTPSYITPPSGYKTDHIDGGGKVTGVKTYNAYYMPIEYTLTFDAQGGTSEVASKKVMFDDRYGTLPVAIRPGYTFDGWNTKKDGTGTMIKGSDIYTTAGNQTVYAQWTPNVYTITLDNQNAGSAGTKEYYEKYAVGMYTTSACSTTISSITIPIRTGWTFHGYYTEKGGGGTQYINASGTITATSTTFTEDTTLYAHWTVNKYTIKYNANGGTGTMSSTSATYGIPVMLNGNTFTRTGWTFMGWSTSTSGSVVYDDKQYVESLSSTNGATVNLYAVWSINSYNVTYDYSTNGGTSASKTTANVNYGDAIDLSVTASKSGYTFVGWNTDPTATTGLTSLTMSTNNVKLYAIFKKTITITFIEKGNSGNVTTTLSTTVYNNTVTSDFIVPQKATWTGWTNIGWTDQTTANAAPITSTGATFTSGSNVTLYALYKSPITIEYNTNGAAIQYDSKTKEAFYNAYGTSLYPSFVIEAAPTLSNHSFVKWKDESGATYTPGATYTLTANKKLTAEWDAFPVLEVYNRHFTLEQAKNGAITQAELLKKVSATDREDGTLTNGTSVIVKNYNASVFTSITGDIMLDVTYIATDSFGNSVEKTITVTITDTTVKESTTKKYVRFISKDFLTDASGNDVSSNNGGLEETSVWRKDETYRTLLRKTLLNEKTGVETKKIKALGMEWEVEIVGSGEWNQKEEEWYFTKEQIREIKSKY